MRTSHTKEILPNPHHACQRSSTILSSFLTTTNLAAASITQAPMRKSRYTCKIQICPWQALIVSVTSITPNIIHWVSKFKFNSLFNNTVSNTLANLKACVPKFNLEALLDHVVNIERRWKQWFKNFECCITFEGVTDQPSAPSKKKAALLL